MEILSIFDVTDAKTKEEWKEEVEGFGQDAISYLRKQYPRWSRFVFKGFQIKSVDNPEGVFKRVNLGPNTR